MSLTQAQLYKDAFDTGVFVAQDLAIMAKPWVAGDRAPDPLFDANGIVANALNAYATCGEVEKKAGASLTPDAKYNPIEGYGSRAARRRLLDSEGLALEFTPQESRMIVHQIQNNWDSGAFQRTSTGGWRAVKSAGDRPKYWTMFVLAEDVNDETGEPIWQWWHVGKMGTDKGSKTSLTMDAALLGAINLEMFQDGNYLWEMGQDGPGLTSLMGRLGFDSRWLVTLGTPSAGTFTLTVDGQTTTALAYTATAAAVKSALEALSSVGAGNVIVTAPAAGGPYTITLQSGGVLTGSGASLTGGTFSVAAA